MRSSAHSWFAAVSVALVSAVALAQPPAAPNGEAPRPQMPAPKNLKVLPKDITSEHLIQMMRQFTGELGVKCEFCHAQNPETKRNDFASDANPVKESARFMISMTSDLNDKYLSEMPGRRHGDPITCGTCHQGHSHPEPFVVPPRPAAGAPPAGAAAPPPPAK